MDTNGTPAYLKCSNPKGGVFRIDTKMVKFDPGPRSQWFLKRFLQRLCLVTRLAYISFRN